MESHKGPTIALIVDDSISHEKGETLNRIVNGLRQTFSIELIQGKNLSESSLLKKIQEGGFQLVLVPLHYSQKWEQIEGFLGPDRTAGPTVAGYFYEAVPLHQLPTPSGQMRKILLDFLNLSLIELTLLIRSLAQDTLRSGLTPLFKEKTLIHCESWYGGHGQGTRLDHIFALSEIAKSEWVQRSSSIRILLGALWGLIYDEEPRRNPAPSGQSPRAYFQIGADSHCLAVRLIYPYPQCSAQETLIQFWPNSALPTGAAQLLLKYSDFLRVHTIPENSNIEIVAGLFQSAPSLKNPDSIHSLWIDSLAARLIQEKPYEAPNPNFPQLRALPNVSLPDSKPRVVAGPNKSLLETPLDKSEERKVLDATAKIKALKLKEVKKENSIHKLKTRNTGRIAPLPLLDAESLLETFQQRYFDAKFQIRQFEIQIATLEKKQASPPELHDLRLRMEALQNREKSWIKKLLATLALFKDAAKKAKD